jgi:hypothetical protein
MKSVALGVVVLNRVDKLERLLESVEGTSVGHVYVADNGRETEEKCDLYAREFGYDLAVIDVEYDAGLGRSRDEIVQRFDEDFLLVADSDHEIRRDISPLLSIMKECPELGGVAGSLVEPDYARIWQSAKNFREDGTKLLRSPAYEEVNVEEVRGYTLARFDFVPYPTLYRKECIEEYSWDPVYPLGRAHVDFYVGHWKQTKWEFGVCPEIHFGHYPGGDPDYATHRESSEKYQNAVETFKKKWGYSAVEMPRSHWYDTYHDDRTEIQKAKELYNTQGPKQLLYSSIRRIVKNIKSFYSD